MRCVLRLRETSSMKILHQAVSDGTTIKTNSLRTGAGLSIHARAFRKSLLPIAAKKIPRLGPVDVSEGDSVHREGSTGWLFLEEERRGNERGGGEGSREARGYKVPSSSLNPIAPYGLARLRNKGSRILKDGVSALVLACGVRVGADGRYKIWCCIGNPLALHSAACFRGQLLHSAVLSRGLELMEPIIGPCMPSRSDLSTTPSNFFSILTTPSLW
ncbi:hypothetical protein C4D60_Mb01t12090 [Musa balbisiana]|uniref:Uncharacterized protein n=1 Tax=Musa balbisiana TaxID=52838 RepID=A0A4S8JLV7_MUSBA|nr:hypothetical protein C4D60_Mb01t12090 [Musa balbisiana]